MNNETPSEINSITGNPQLSLKNSSGEAELITEASGALNDLARADRYTEKYLWGSQEAGSAGT